ncbi:hypothetical protein PRIPAC_93284, partial [Pristionchus pacificus]
VFINHTNFQCLLFSLALFWVVHSLKVIVDFHKCKTKEYYCLVTPDVAMTRDSPDFLVPSDRDFQHDKKPYVGILIQPLAVDKWVFIIHSNISVDKVTGIYVAAVPKGLSVMQAHDSNTKIRKIAGCQVDGDELVAIGEHYHLRIIESSFDSKNLICVGMLTTTTSIAEVLEAYKATSSSKPHELRLMYDVSGDRATTHFARTLATDTLGSPINFLDVNEIMQCDFTMLRMAEQGLLRTHYNRPVDTFMDPINCTMYEGFHFDLLVQLAGSTEVLVTKKITCFHHDLFAHSDTGGKTSIKSDAIVACGERLRCSKMPPAVCEGPECEPPTKVDETCDLTKEKCEELKCPDNHWFINDKIEVKNGRVVCRKESIEDGSSPRWFANYDNKFVPLDKGSCLKLYECQEKNPIQSTCDGVNHTESCAKATFTRTKIYCPVNHDLKYKEEIDGNETAIDALFCDKKVGQWKLNITANETKIANVYCIFNKDRDNILLGGKAFTKEAYDTSDDFWYAFKHYWPMLFTPLLIPIPYFLFLWWQSSMRARKMKKCNAFYEEACKRRCERFQESWSPEEKWAVRPYNSHNYRGGTETLLPDLRYLDGKCCPKILWKEFSLYSPEEKYMYLENCIGQFSTKEKVVNFVMPLLYKCTEHDENWDNSKQAMHPKLVEIAFKILKLLVNIYSKRGDQKSADRIRKVIGIRANNMLFPMGLEKARDESQETTEIRILGLEAALFAGNEEIEDRLLKLWQEKGFEISNPARKFAWAVAVKNDCQLGVMVQKWNEETIKYHANWGKPKDPVDEKWGDIMEHLFYAICAEPEERTLLERVFHQVIQKKLFNKQHILSGFRSVMEVFDYNQSTGRIMFREQHPYICKKMGYTGTHFREIWRLIYTYSAFYPGHQGWLLPFAAKTFPDDVRIHLLPEALTYVEIYNGVYKFKTVAAAVEEELGKVETIKPDAVEEDLKFRALLKGRSKFRKKVKAGWSKRSWKDEEFRKKPTKEGAKNSKNSKASKESKDSKNQSASKASKKPVESMKQGPGGLVEREDNMEDKGDGGKESKNEQKDSNVGRKPPPPKETPMILQ